MSEFRLSKYDPALRDERGAYTRDEWTSISDVVEHHDSAKPSMSDYLAVEDAYIESVARFMSLAGVERLSVTDLERHGDEDASARQECEGWLVEGVEISGERLNSAIRLALRERIWCRLLGRDAFYVHFGYDYYVYIGRRGAPLDAPPLPPGMFAEPFPSPYWLRSDQVEEC